MFALPRPPSDTLELSGRTYRLVRIFKHDFFAATCLYALAGDGSTDGDSPRALPKLVVKFCRAQPFWGLPGTWIGQILSSHEQAIHGLLEGVRGVPRWARRIDETTHAVEYVEGRPLDHPPLPAPEFFDRLLQLLQEVHARGVAHCDTNKRSNILISVEGEPFLVDYQLARRHRDDLPWPLRVIARAVVSYVALRDIYHVCKHKRRMCPEALTEEQRRLSSHRSRLHRLHRKLSKRWRVLRRWFLRSQYAAGHLVSPTAQLEDHHQPEKASWRDGQGTEP